MFAAAKTLIYIYIGIYVTWMHTGNILHTRVFAVATILNAIFQWSAMLMSPHHRYSSNIVFMSKQHFSHYYLFMNYDTMKIAINICAFCLTLQRLTAQFVERFATYSSSKRVHLSIFFSIFFVLFLFQFFFTTAAATAAATAAIIIICSSRLIRVQYQSNVLFMLSQQLHTAYLYCCIMP